MPPRDPIFRLEGLAAGYEPGDPIVSDVNLTVQPGSWITILGPNGAGKSTLLKTLLGVLKPLKGKVESSTRSFGYVRQDLHCPRQFLLTTEEYLSLNPEVKTSLKGNAWVSRLKVDAFLSTPLCHLSVGQFKRAQLVFALLGDPEVLFLDEYLEGLDSGSKTEAEVIIRNFNEAQGKTVIEVSHDLTSLAASSKRVLFVNGKVTYDGLPSGQGFHSCLHHAYGEGAILREDPKGTPK